MKKQFALPAQYSQSTLLITGSTQVSANFNNILNDHFGGSFTYLRVEGKLFSGGLAVLETQILF